MKIYIGFEKRDWGTGKRTWREVPAMMTKYKKRSRGPSEYAVRRVTNKKAKTNGYL